MRNPKVSEIIFALEQIEEMCGDKEVCQLLLHIVSTEMLLSVEFIDYEQKSIEVVTDERY